MFVHFLVKNVSKKVIKSVILHTVLHVFRRWLLLRKICYFSGIFSVKYITFCHVFHDFLLIFVFFKTFLLHILYETYRVQLFTKINQQKYSLLLDKLFIRFYLKITKYMFLIIFRQQKVIKITKRNKKIQNMIILLNKKVGKYTKTITQNIVLFVQKVIKKW